MTSGSHLSKDLLDLVKSIGESRSKQEEDRIISNEASLLKMKFTERNLSEKKMKELLIRAIYVEMLGHDASFSHINAVNLTQSKNLLVKRIGYLSSSLFIDENSELIILMISTMQKDLQSRNHLEILAALNCLSKLSNAQVMQGVYDLVTKLLDHQHEMIRKKAVMVMIKFNKITPVDQMHVKMKKALCDKDPSVMACSLHYFLEEIKAKPSDYKDLVNHFIIILKQIIDHRLPRDYDYHRIPAPWIQSRLLEILSYLGQDDENASKQMYEIITTVIKRSDDSAINIGYALVYQCLRTITRIYPSQELLDLATLTISRFLSSTSKNLKYMGIVGLIQIVKIDPKYTLDYQNMVVDCLEDVDDTLKIRTLELLYKMTNKQNVEPIVEKLLSYLKAAPIESSSRKQLVVKINELGEKFAPSKNWYVRTMNKVFEMGGDLITQDLTNKFITSIAEYQKQEDGEKFRESTIKSYIKVLKKNPTIPESHMQVIAWIMGEYGPDMPDQDKIDSIVNELCIQAYVGFESHVTNALIISALVKLHLSRGFAPNPQIEAVMRDFSNSKHINVQQRCSEYHSLRENYTRISNNGLDLFKNTPINQEQLDAEGMDLDLNFLHDFVDQERAKGKASYDQIKSLTEGNMSIVPVAQLNYEAYKQETPSFVTFNQPLGAQGANPANKETTSSNPVFASQQTSNSNTVLQVGHVKQTWGTGAEPEPNSSDNNVKPSESATSHYQSNNMFNAVQNKVAASKKEVPMSQADEKKEQMKNSLFMGISSKKDDSDSDEKKPEEEKVTQPEPMNLLEMDTPPTTSGGIDLLGGDQPSSSNVMDLLGGPSLTQPSGPNDLLSINPATQNGINDLLSGPSETSNNVGGLLDMGGSQPTQPFQEISSQFGDILGGFNQPAQSANQVKFQPVPGFNTAMFGQTWMQLSQPGCEQKANINCPLGISSAGDKPGEYGTQLQAKLGIQKIEVINNEVIAAGQSITDSSVTVLVHGKVDPPNLSFTVRTNNAQVAASLIQDLQTVFV